MIRPASGLKLLIKLTPYNKAIIELTIAGIIWGASFTAVRWALEDFSTTTLMFWRFMLAIVGGEVFLFLVSRKDFDNSWSDLRLSAKAGMCLGVSLLFQIYGLNFTTATNSGFITSLYVILIPIIGTLFFKHKIYPRHILLSLTAFAGMGLLLDLREFTMQKGDVLTLGAALTAALQIIFIGQSAPKAKSAFRFNTFQTFWSLVMVLPFLVFETVAHKVPLAPAAPGMRAVLSVIALAFVVSLFAFYMQVRAQRVLNTTTSSMLCLLEGPFAFFFGAIFLGETLSTIQASGAVLILGSCAFSVFLDRPVDGKS
ncbi:MAG: transrane protein [Pseudobdellovibrio sp.]|nr:transrane protein [Pseudobdellovibrio sp.]